MTIPLSGFSKFSREQRINYIREHSQFANYEATSHSNFNHQHEDQLFESMIENWIGNFAMPLGVVPHLLINGESFIVPYVIEESSVVAAASKAAKFWATRGGFSAKVESMTKKGQIHFTWNGRPEEIARLFPEISSKLIQATEVLTARMRQRGGGIFDIRLIDKTIELTDYYQIDVSFDTVNAMGANFINSCLESMASVLRRLPELNHHEKQAEVIMSILSNYSPNCKVKSWVECPIEELAGWNNQFSGSAFAGKFKQAVDIANLDISRAATHNKGIFNGIDAVLLATGNDCRATAASAHAWASRDGHYKSFTTITLTDKIFHYELELPLSVGTVGGITQIHPMVKSNLAMMNDPDARKLMMIAAASGLANNFAAIASLISSGIQEGHMRMHLQNILNQLHVNNDERAKAINRFSSEPVSYAAVENYILQLRTI